MLRTSIKSTYKITKPLTLVMDECSIYLRLRSVPNVTWLYAVGLDDDDADKTRRNPKATLYATLTLSNYRCSLADIVAAVNDDFGSKCFSTLQELICAKYGGIRQVFQVAYDISMALRVMHANDIIHGDIKPENILVDNITDDVFRVVLTDFDHSFMCGDDVGSVVTSLFTRAPEIADGAVPIHTKCDGEIHVDDFDTSIDIYSLGATLMIMLTGISRDSESYSSYISEIINDDVKAVDLCECVDECDVCERRAGTMSRLAKTRTYRYIKAHVLIEYDRYHILYADYKAARKYEAMLSSLSSIISECVVTDRQYRTTAKVIMAKLERGDNVCYHTHSREPMEKYYNGKHKKTIEYGNDDTVAQIIAFADKSKVISDDSQLYQLFLEYTLVYAGTRATTLELERAKKICVAVLAMITRENSDLYQMVSSDADISRDVLAYVSYLIGAQTAAH